MKEKKTLDYKILKKDFIFVNVLIGMALLWTFLFMLLQQIDVIPNMTCVLHDVMHVYCPGCGGTRAIFTLLEGRVLDSLYYNPAVVLGALLILHYEVGVLVTLIKKNGKRYYCSNLTLVVLYMVIMVVFTIVRNYLLLGCGYDMLQDFIPR